jgi:hypothetical protein
MHQRDRAAPAQHSPHARQQLLERKRPEDPLNNRRPSARFQVSAGG